MEILHGLDGLRSLAAGAVLSIGNFDGMHRGHLALLSMARTLKEREGASTLAVATFEPHPLTVLRPELAPPRLTPAGVKARLLEGHGVDALVVLPPTPEVLGLTAEAFWAIIRDGVRPKHLVEGDSFTFGKGRAGTIPLLRQWCAAAGVQLHVAEPVSVPLLDLQVAPVSSTLVRWLLANGRVRDAAICLGRAYAIDGPVVKGQQRGRLIGFPTANLRVTEQLIPADGVYAARGAVDGRTYPAALSIGRLPTFGPDEPHQVEAYLVGFEGDLYGRTLTVEVIDWLREQRKYPSLEALKAQLHEDVRVTARLSEVDPSRPIAAA